jgi:Cdc6-like AAA superfamily ATPase
MIRDARVLRAGFVPREIEHRDPEVNALSRVLEPVADGQPAETVVVTGPSGAGKTCVSKFTTDRLRQAALDIETTYVNCWQRHTRFRALYSILDDITSTVDIHRQSTPHDELEDRLQGYDGHRTVVVLDEADQLDDPGLIYDLHTLDQFALVLIVNDRDDLFTRVDDRLVSRLRASDHVPMDRYHDHQLQDILAARAHRGLNQDAISSDQLARIADAAAGDARLAIGILRNAAQHAQQRREDTITDDILLDAADTARTDLRRKTLDSLIPHQRVVVNVLRDHGPLDPSSVYDHYTNRVDDPKTDRTVRSYLKKLAEYNIVAAEGSTVDRTYDLAEDIPSPSPA